MIRTITTARKHATRITLCLMTAVLIFGIAVQAKADPIKYIYIADGGTGPIAGAPLSGTVKRVDADGSNLTTLVINLQRPRGLAVDQANGFVYWNDWEAMSTERADLDGNGRTLIIPHGRRGINDIAIDSAGGKMYISLSISTAAFHGVKRYNLDGTMEEVVWDANSNPFAGNGWFLDGVGLDLANGHVYFGDIGILAATGGPHGIIRTDLDGSNPVSLVPHQDGRGRGMAVDSANNTMYFASHIPGGIGGPGFGAQIGIWQANLDGSGLVKILDDVTDGLARPRDVALDTMGQRLYWVDEGTGKLQSVNVDGGTMVVQDVVTGLQSPDSLDFVTNPAPTANDDVPSPGGPGDPISSGVTINIDVLANDDGLDDFDDEATAINIVSPPNQGGTATVVGTAPNLSVDYTPPGGFGGTESFQYTVDDTQSTSNAATVTITVDGGSNETPPGPNRPVFGGAAFPGSSAGASAAGEQALTGGTSTINCCTVLDWRVFQSQGQIRQQDTYFDVGDALSHPDLADDACANLPAIGRDNLIIDPWFGVHIDPSISNPVPSDFRFGVCAVETGVEWRGPIFVDAAAPNVVGYQVDCNEDDLNNQPITMGLPVDPPGDTAPSMRSVSTDCDPRGIDRWSTWFYVVNATHLTDVKASQPYVSIVIRQTLDMIDQIAFDNAADADFLHDLRGLVVAAEIALRNTNFDPALAVRLLDDATRLALLIPTMEPGSPSPPLFDPYGSSVKVPNPKGDLVSFTSSLRYTVCSELLNPGNLFACKMQPDIVDALPDLPSQQ